MSLVKGPRVGKAPQQFAWLVAACWFLCIPASATAAATAKSSDKVSYNRDIRPILSDNCFFCHGPDSKKRKAKLRLDIREEALAKSAFVPGEPEKSELIRRIFT